MAAIKFLSPENMDDIVAIPAGEERAVFSPTMLYDGGPVEVRTFGLGLICASEEDAASTERQQASISVSIVVDRLEYQLDYSRAPHLRHIDVCMENDELDVGLTKIYALPLVSPTPILLRTWSRISLQVTRDLDAGLFNGEIGVLTFGAMYDSYKYRPRRKRSQLRQLKRSAERVGDLLETDYGATPMALEVEEPAPLADEQMD